LAWAVVRESARQGWIHGRDMGIQVPWVGSGRRYPEDSPMSDEHTKTPLDHVTDTLSQLKEMRHYSKNNVELLTTQWLMFDGELSKLGRADKIEDLMVRQGELHDALEAVIANLEELQGELQPPAEE
jgi:hypothetical protein